jgi:S1-C subfamily serine protease
MKRIPVPTAPGERAKWQDPTPKRIGWLVLTLLLSLASGFSGALLARVYQADNYSSATPDLIIVPDNTASGSATVVKNLQEQQSEAIVLVEAEETVLGTGVQLSSDGWVVTLAELLGEHQSFTIETYNGKQYRSDQFVVDTESGLAYIHCNQTGARVAEFRNTPAELGDSVIAYGRTSAGDTVAFASVAADTSLDRILPSHFKGVPLYDLNYAVAGFATDTDQFIPIEAVNTVAYGLFTTGTILRDE